MTNPESTALTSEHRGNWMFVGFCALWVLGAPLYMTGGAEYWFGLLVYALFAPLFRHQHARDPRQNWISRLYPFVFAIFLIGLSINAYSTLESVPPYLTEAAIKIVALRFLALLAYDALMYVSYRNPI